MSVGWLSAASTSPWCWQSWDGLALRVRRHARRPIYLAVYSAFIGVTAESAIIDTDHWRHYFLLLGLLWGLMIAAGRYARDRRSLVASGQR